MVLWYSENSTYSFPFHPDGKPAEGRKGKWLDRKYRSLFLNQRPKVTFHIGWKSWAINMNLSRGLFLFKDFTGGVIGN